MHAKNLQHCLAYYLLVIIIITPVIPIGFDEAFFKSLERCMYIVSLLSLSFPFIPLPLSLSLYLSLFLSSVSLFATSFRAHTREHQPSDQVIYFSHAHFCFNNYHIDSECITLQE